MPYVALILIASDTKINSQVKPYLQQQLEIYDKNKTAYNIKDSSPYILLSLAF